MLPIIRHNHWYRLSLGRKDGTRILIFLAHLSTVKWWVYRVAEGRLGLFTCYECAI